MSEQPKSDEEPSAHGGLGPFLAKLRKAKGLTLRDVEEASREHEEADVVSNAYVSQLENGKVTDPSPHVLHSLALIYGGSYESLMTRAGYFMPDGRGKRVGTFAELDLTPKEEEELIAYLRFRRSQEKDGR